MSLARTDGLSRVSMTMRSITAPPPFPPFLVSPQSCPTGSSTKSLVPPCHLWGQIQTPAWLAKSSRRRVVANQKHTEMGVKASDS